MNQNAPSLRLVKPFIASVGWLFLISVGIYTVYAIAGLFLSFGGALSSIPAIGMFSLMTGILSSFLFYFPLSLLLASHSAFCTFRLGLPILTAIILGILATIALSPWGKPFGTSIWNEPVGILLVSLHILVGAFIFSHESHHCPDKAKQDII